MSAGGFHCIADPGRDCGSGGPVTDTPCHDGIAGTHASSTDLTDSAKVISPFKNLAQMAVTAPSEKVGREPADGSRLPRSRQGGVGRRAGEPLARPFNISQLEIAITLAPCRNHESRCGCHATLRRGS